MSGAAAEGAPTYVLGYPRPVRLARAAVTVLLAGGAVVHWVLAWIDFAGPALEALNAGGGGLRPAVEALAIQPLRPLLAAHLGLLLAAWAIAIAGDLLPDLALADGGFLVRRLRRWSLVPWSSVRAVRAMHLGGERYLVLVQGRWGRLAAGPRLVSLLLGAGAVPGVLLTSAMRDFLPFMERLYHEVKAAVAEPVLDDAFYSLPAALAVDPGAAAAIGALLERHGLGFEKVSAPRAVAAETCTLLRVEEEFDDVYSRYGGRTIVKRAPARAWELPAGSLWIPLRGEDALRAALLLEPAAMYGLWQYPDFRALVAPDGTIPVRRVVEAAR